MNLKGENIVNMIFKYFTRRAAINAVSSNFLLLTNKVLNIKGFCRKNLISI